MTDLSFLFVFLVPILLFLFVHLFVVFSLIRRFVHLFICFIVAFCVYFLICAIFKFVHFSSFICLFRHASIPLYRDTVCLFLFSYLLIYMFIYLFICLLIYLFYRVFQKHVPHFKV